MLLQDTKQVQITAILKKASWFSGGMPLLTDKQQKKEFKAVASKDPERYYPTTFLKKEGFSRKQCKCGTFFWSTTTSKVCGDPGCSGGFRFYDDNPAKNKMGYIQVWNRFAKLFEKFGYTPIKRYPVVARWNPGLEYTIASIVCFQPWVITGEVEPPSKHLTIPQFCLRFGDIDNVGITGSHMTGFVMIGQHSFVPAKEFDQEHAFSALYTWFTKELGLPKKEITIHEDAWAGGGSYGPCMEFFSRGVELANQVYHLFEQTAQGPRELKLKVLDMGLGMERNAWFSQGTSTMYDATFPTVMEKLRNTTGFTADEKIMKKFVPLAGYLNVDEIDDIETAWKKIAKEINVEVETLKKNVLPSAALYSIAEHSRTLLVALHDGALPSNVGGGYNLRLLIRRMLGFIEQYNWNMDLKAIADWHAEYLKPLFPELTEHLDDVHNILDVEKAKFLATRQKSRQTVERLLRDDKKIDEALLLQLYDSQGISPELIKEEAEKLGKKIMIPDNFYGRVSALHEKKEQIHEEKKEFPLQDIAETDSLYFSNYLLDTCKAKVLKVLEGKYVVLDKTVFYPTGGGQLHDIGTMNDENVVEVLKQGMYIIHVVPNTKLKKNDHVVCKIDLARRKQLAQHHTATHIINAAAKRVLGNHINQAGAKKTVEKAHIDITHYESLKPEELEKIEKEANKIVKEAITMHKKFMPRTEAEQKYGMGIYQGGVAPGKTLRIVEIPEVDVECCGGTHLDNTREAELIKIEKATKIQDGIVRITFTAGKAARSSGTEEHHILEEAAQILHCEVTEVPARAEELFTKWKKAKKEASKGNLLDKELFVLTKKEKCEGDALTKTATILKTQPEHIIRTIERFMKELNEMKKR